MILLRVGPWFFGFSGPGDRSPSERSLLISCRESNMLLRLASGIRPPGNSLRGLGFRVLSGGAVSGTFRIHADINYPAVAG